jgi:hypothetical protein
MWCLYIYPGWVEDASRAYIVGKAVDSGENPPPTGCCPASHITKAGNRKFSHMVLPNNFHPRHYAVNLALEFHSMSIPKVYCKYSIQLKKLRIFEVADGTLPIFFMNAKKS